MKIAMFIMTLRNTLADDKMHVTRLMQTLQLHNLQ